MDKRFEDRRSELLKWLSENAPYVAADQKHLDENTPERAYWHHGYLSALTDVATLSPGGGAVEALKAAVTDIKSIHEKAGEHGLLNQTAAIQTLCRNALDQIDAALSSVRAPGEVAGGGAEIPLLDQLRARADCIRATNFVHISEQDARDFAEIFDRAAITIKDLLSQLAGWRKREDDRDDDLL